jgi:transposase
VRHAEEPQDHALGRSRGGYGTKFHLVTDSNGIPLAVEVTAGQVHESTQVEAVMDQIAIPQPLGRPRKRPERLAGDKAYRCQRVRDWLWKYGIKPVIPIKKNEKKKPGREELFDELAYKQRSIIENCVSWLKECRRIATRYEKLALNYLGMLKLAMIERYLRVL